jgi:chaperone modulatory protein CbpM
VKSEKNKTMAPLKNAIKIEQLADFYNIDALVIYELADFGIIDLKKRNKQEIIPHEELERCERAVRLYCELGVNKEGIEIILDMREKMEQLQKDLLRAHHRLNRMTECTETYSEIDFFEIE